MINFNYNILNNRIAHEQYLVKNGKLVQICTLRDKIYYFFHRTQVQAMVKSAITDVVTHYKKDDVNEFYEKMSRLSEKVFDRTKISKDERYELIKQIDETDKKLRKVRLALKLGVGFKMISEGNSGSYFLKDIKNTIHYVFKPEDQSSQSGNSPKLLAKIETIIRAIFPMFSFHKNLRANDAAASEVRSYTLDNQLGLGIVPNTFVCTIKDKKGSCQEFVPNARFAKDKIKDVALEDFKKLVILDFLIANQDRHSKNWLVDSQNRIVAIDNGLAYPEKYPTLLPHAYAWKREKLARECFKLEDAILCQNINYNELNLNDEQVRLMKRRKGVLMAAIQQGRQIKYLGGIKTKKDFIRAEKQLRIV